MRMASISAAAPATRRRNETSAVTVVARRQRACPVRDSANRKNWRHDSSTESGSLAELLEELGDEPVVVDAGDWKTGHDLNLHARWSPPQTSVWP